MLNLDFLRERQIWATSILFIAFGMWTANNSLINYKVIKIIKQGTVLYLAYSLPAFLLG